MKMSFTEIKKSVENVLHVLMIASHGWYAPSSKIPWIGLFLIRR